MSLDPGNNPKVQALQARMNNAVYVRHWQVPLMKTCMAKPGYCCYAMWWWVVGQPKQFDEVKLQDLLFAPRPQHVPPL
jgi:hypothetical protein